MKKLIVILGMLVMALNGFAQYNAAHMRAYYSLTADSTFIFHNDTFYGTTQINSVDTVLVSKDYLSTVIENRYGLVEGGVVVWDSAFVFNVQAASYFINSVLYQSALDTVTLAASHVSLSRIDVIALDVNNNAVVIQGVPAAAPIKPYVNISQQLELTYIFIGAGDVVPVNMLEETIYKESDVGEWVVDGGAGITYYDSLSTNPVFRGTYALRLDSIIHLDTVTFSKPSGTNNTSAYETISFFIKTKTKPDCSVFMFGYFTLNGVRVSTAKWITSTTLFTDTASWHLFSYKITDFIWTESTFDGFSIEYYVWRAFSAIQYKWDGMSIDNMTLQKGVPPPPLIDLSGLVPYTDATKMWI